MVARNSQLYFTRNWWPQVVVATNVNPKLLQNVLPKVLVFDFLTSCVFLNATLGTYFYFDTESGAGQSVFEAQNLNFPTLSFNQNSFS
ncbi:hypothetical protein HID58_085758 [Brassica napus]|uniref:Uncharacterized protein n=1 Tax=Brassica napus TaxID=3708 RepID=A0ABQ7XNH6_BRANA|nr:hypothetical protein HID58_085758 [Brassica napus]